MTSRFVKFFIFSILLSTQAFATTVGDRDYNYPYSKDAVLATMSSALMKADDDTIYTWEKIHVLPERANTPAIGDREGLNILFYSQHKKAPLMIVMAGLGGRAGSGYVKYYAEQFFHKGFNVVTMPSPYNWSFALSASTSAFPGVTKRDAADVYRAIQVTLKTLQEEYTDFSYTKIGFFSSSMGALEGAYLAALDEEKQELNIDKFLLVNPPVNLVTGSKKLDYMFGSSYQALGPIGVEKLEAKIFNFGYHAIYQSRISDPNYFLDLDKRLPLSNDQKLFLVGASLREPLADSIIVSQQVHDQKILNSPYTWLNPEPRFAEARQNGFVDYINKFLLPEVSEERGVNVSLDDLAQESNFTEELAEKISANDKVFLMHNVDDLLVSQEDLAFLQKTFGEDRYTLYPSGGHLGNLWFERNRKDILNTFKDLLDDKEQK